jgi:hypothetical protein
MNFCKDCKFMSRGNWWDRLFIPTRFAKCLAYPKTPVFDKLSGEKLDEPFYFCSTVRYFINRDDQCSLFRPKDKL